MYSDLSLKTSFLVFIPVICVSFLAVADVAILANKVFLSLQAVNEAEDQLAVIDRLEHSYVSAAMRQLVCSYDILIVQFPFL